MIILITGKPNTGKSTAIHKIVDMLGRKRCSGLLAEEILVNNERVGFSTYGIQSKDKITLAHVDIDKKYAVEIFGVDLKALESLSEKELDIALRDDKIKFIIVDEIGRMQVMSEKFRNLLDKIADSNKILIASICFEDEVEYIRDFKNRDDVELIILNEENRNEIPLKVIEEVNKDDDLYHESILI